MGMLEEADRVVLTAVVARGRMVAEMDGNDAFRLTVDDEWYRDSTSDLLAIELGRAARLIVAKRLRALDDLVRSCGPPRAPLVQGSRVVRELAALDQHIESLTADGASAGGHVRLIAVGMRDVAAVVAPDTGTALDSLGFCRAAAEAASALLADRMAGVWQARAEHSRATTTLGAT